MRTSPLAEDTGDTATDGQVMGSTAEEHAMSSLSGGAGASGRDAEAPEGAAGAASASDDVVVILVVAAAAASVAAAAAAASFKTSEVRSR